MNNKINHTHRAVKRLRRATERHYVSVEVNVVSFKKYKKDMYCKEGYKQSSERLELDKVIREANGRPIEWVRSEMRISNLPKEWTKKVRIPLMSLLNNWKENI